ncbi:uncharacterized protein LOC136026241 [Artemia franciscana]|uniref:uncharacterized protein LOC136026241 n=1 Tax=Artemia franciscana TaxID=6661 RepID=UPI0032DA3713
MEMYKPSAFMRVLSVLNEQDSPVMTIRCNGGYVEAKKIHLAAISEVFKKMLDSKKLGKETNLIEADDVDFDTMKSIMDFYKEGNVSNYEGLNRDKFSYIIEKYKFIGIKEEIAENVLDKYFEKQDIEILESIFFTYTGHNQKAKAIQELALLIIKGKEGPDFVGDFCIIDFFELSRICCQALNGWDISRFKGFLDTLFKWQNRDSENRSIPGLEIAGMIDINGFSCYDVKSVLKGLKLPQKLQGFKKIIEKTCGCGCT